MKAEVLVLGGGMSGVVVANELQSALGKEEEEEVHVSLIDRRRNSQFPPSFVWVMLGERQPEDVQRELALLQRKGIDVINGEVTAIDTERRTVSISSSVTPRSYDYLVVALGAEYAPEVIPGFTQYANHNYDLDSALKLRKVLEKFQGGSVAVGVSRLPYKCPVAPYEAALLLQDRFAAKEGGNSKTEFAFFTPEEAPLPAAGPAAGAMAQRLLKEKGVNIHTKIRLKEITERSQVFENGETIEYDLLYCVPPHRAPRVVTEAGLADERGWILSDPKTMETKIPGVYAIGDVAAFRTPKAFVPYLPKAGTFAVGQARTVANNIINQVKGTDRKQVYDGHGTCFMEVGGGMSAEVEGNFFGEEEVVARGAVKFKQPSSELHHEKEELERRWMNRWF